MPLEPLRDQVGGEKPRRLAAGHRQRWQPDKAIQGHHAIAVTAVRSRTPSLAAHRPSGRENGNVRAARHRRLRACAARHREDETRCGRPAARAACGRQNQLRRLRDPERGDRPAQTCVHHVWAKVSAGATSAPKGGDIGGVFLRAALEYGRARHQHGGAGGNRAWRFPGVTPPSTSARSPARSRRCVPGGGDLVELTFDEALATEAGIHRHDQNEIDQVHQIVDRRSIGVPGLSTTPAFLPSLRM